MELSRIWYAVARVGVKGGGPLAALNFAFVRRVGMRDTNVWRLRTERMLGTARTLPADLLPIHSLHALHYASQLAHASSQLLHRYLDGNRLCDID